MIRDRTFYRSILRLSFPTAIQSLLSLLVVMADNVMVTRLDGMGYNLAAVSQSNSVTAFANIAMSGFASGAVVLISQYWGKKDIKRIKPICAAALAVCLGTALLFILAIMLFPGGILRLVISAREVEVTALARVYLPIVSFSFLPFAVSAAVIGILRGVEVVRVTLYAAAVSLVFNIGLNYVFIFGKLGLPAMGVMGAAIATVLARLIEMVLVVYYLFRIQGALPLAPRDLLVHRRWAWTDFGKYSLPVGLVDAQWALVDMLKMVVIGQLGRVMINASAVTDMMMRLGTMFTSALAGGAAVLVGKAVGSKDYALVRQYSKTIQIMFIFIGLLMALIVYLLRVPFVALYRMEPETAGVAIVMIVITAPTLVGTSYHASCFVGINRGAGDNRFVMMVDMVCGWLIVLPMTVLSAFVLHLPFHWIYFATRIDQSFKWLIAYLRLRGNKWIHLLTREDEA